MKSSIANALKMTAAVCLAVFACAVSAENVCADSYTGDGEEGGYGDERVWISEDSVIVGEKDGASLMLVDTSGVLEQLSRLPPPDAIGQLEREILYKTVYWLDGDEPTVLEARIVAIVSYDEYGRPKFHEAVRIGALTVKSDGGCYVKSSANWSPEKIAEARQLLQRPD